MREDETLGRRKTREIAADMAALFSAAATVIFLTARLSAFLELAWGLCMPAWLCWAVSASGAAAAFCFRGQAAAFLKRNVSLGPAGIAMAAAFSAAFCLCFRHSIVEKPLAGAHECFGAAGRLAAAVGAAVLLSAFLLILFSAGKRGLARLAARLRTIKLKDVAAMAAVLVCLNLFSCLYVKKSSTVYIWDVAGYWQITWALADAARQGVWHLLSVVYNSILELDYNYLIALPWTPLVLAFGRSRLVFVKGIVNFGLFPIMLLLYFFIKGRCRRSAFAYVLSVASFPMLFITALRGFIDVVGIIFTLSAAIIAIGDGNENDFGRFFAVGVLLGVAVLLRRWYAFFALSFVIALLVDCAVFRKTLVPAMSALASFVFVLLFFFQPFVVNVLLKDYSKLYSDYKMGISFDFKMFFTYFGAVTAAAVLASGAYLCARRETRRAGVFFMSQAAVCFLLFVRVQSHGQQHLLLYVPSFICLLSLCACRLLDAFDGSRGAFALLAAFALLPPIGTAVPGLHPRQIEKTLSVSVLPDFTFRPPVWPDAYTMVKIVRYLDGEVGSQGGTLGVLGSSFKFNCDVLMNAEASLNLERTSNVDRGYIVPLPAVDSRDPFPGALFDCDYLLVADPVQTHLGEEKQQVVCLPAKMLLRGEGFGAAYRKTGEEFALDGGKIKITIYKKWREVSDSERQDLVEKYRAVKSK